MYGFLAQVAGSPVVELNRAIAIAMTGDIQGGLAIIDQLSSDETLRNYHLVDAARADLLRRTGKTDEALSAYQRALEKTRNEAERSFFYRRVNEISQSPSHRSRDQR
jgi:RNA polymerase sigma-70 factor, ECF subfamily